MEKVFKHWLIWNTKLTLFRLPCKVFKISDRKQELYNTTEL